MPKASPPQLIPDLRIIVVDQSGGLPHISIDDQLEDGNILGGRIQLSLIGESLQQIIQTELNAGSNASNDLAKTHNDRHVLLKPHIVVRS